MSILTVSRATAGTPRDKWRSLQGHFLPSAAADEDGRPSQTIARRRRQNVAAEQRQVPKPKENKRRPRSVSGLQLFRVVFHTHRIDSCILSFSVGLERRAREHNFDHENLPCRASTVDRFERHKIALDRTLPSAVCIDQLWVSTGASDGQLGHVSDNRRHSGANRGGSQHKAVR